MRKASSIIAGAILLLTVSLASWAQGASIVYDPTSFGGILKQIYTQIMNHADQISMSAEQIASIEEVFSETSRIASGMEKVYNEVQPILSKTKVLYEAGQAIQDSYATLAYTSQAYADLFNSGQISYNRFNSALRSTAITAEILKNDYDMISAAMSSAMTAKEKLDIIREARASAAATSAAERFRVKEMIDSINAAQSRQTFNELLTAFTYGTDNNAVDPTNAAMKSVDWDGIFLEDSGMTLSEAESNIKSHNRSVVNLVEIILAILFVISTGWGGAKYFKGDPQNRDILFKTAGGLFFIIVVLQIIKTVLLS